MDVNPVFVKKKQEQSNIGPIEFSLTDPSTIIDLDALTINDPNE